MNFDGFIGKEKIKIETNNDIIMLRCNDVIHTKRITKDYNEVEAISNLLEIYELEVRFCEECGKPFDAGYVEGDGFWYCCEDCFYSAMNRIYGENRWRSTDMPGEWDGYYEFQNDDGVWTDTGIYYTEWN